MERLTQQQIDQVTQYLKSVKNWDSAPAGKWSSKEILGHLIDSGINNLYRYHRILINGERSITGYQQDELVNWQKYSEWEARKLIDTWVALNQLILNFISFIPREQLNLEIELHDGMLHFEAGQKMRLSEMLLDYTQHIDHHIAQIKNRQGPQN